MLNKELEIKNILTNTCINCTLNIASMLLV